MAFSRAGHGEFEAECDFCDEVQTFAGDDFHEAKSTSVKANCKLTLPSAPALVSLAMGVQTKDGGRFFVRNSGSDEMPPQQRKLCTHRGEEIDLETGEIKDAKTAAEAAKT